MRLQSRGGPDPSAPGGGTDPPPDSELVRRARDGDETALVVLLDRYRPLAQRQARSYFLAGAEREDVVQEAVIGLYKAVRDFDPERHLSFAGFAELCVNRQVLTAVRNATRHKHGPLNDYVSVWRDELGEDGGTPLAEALPGPAATDPAELVLSAERLRSVREHLADALSPLEAQVLELHVQGFSYAAIAERLERSEKAVDNALQRIKRKLEAHLRGLDEG